MREAAATVTTKTSDSAASEIPLCETSDASAEVAAAVEKRFDGADGPFSKAEIVEYYGDEADAIWEAAQIAEPEPVAREVYKADQFDKDTEEEAILRTAEDFANMKLAQRRQSVADEAKVLESVLEVAQKKIAVKSQRLQMPEPLFPQLPQVLLMSLPTAAAEE